MPPNKRCCLLVEDGPDDALLLRKHLSGHPHFEFSWVQDGEEAVRFLEREPPYSEAPAPGVILLDLKMPRMGGFEFLKWCRAKELHQAIPVLVVSSSTLPEDMKRARELGVKLYVTKPVNWKRLGQELTMLAWPIDKPPQAARSVSVPESKLKRVTCVLMLPDFKKLTVTACAEKEDQEVRFDYAGDTTKLRPLAENGTLGFLKWYMQGWAWNLGAEIDVCAEEI